MDQFINRFTNLKQLAELTPAEIKDEVIVKENDDRVLSAWFYSGLLPSIYEAIIGHVPPNNLSHWMTEASNTYYAQHRLRRIAPQQHTRKDPNAMDIDAAQVRHPRLSPSERDYRRRNRLCFNCGKEGHMSRECRQKPERQNNDRQRDARSAPTAHIEETEEVNARKATNNKAIQNLVKSLPPGDLADLAEEMYNQGF